MLFLVAHPCGEEVANAMPTKKTLEYRRSRGLRRITATLWSHARESDEFRRLDCSSIVGALTAKTRLIIREEIEREGEKDADEKKGERVISHLFNKTPDVNRLGCSSRTQTISRSL